MAPVPMRHPQRGFNDIVAAVVEEIAPGEEPMLARLSSLDHDVALRGLRRRSDGDGLGFGWPEMLTYLTPALYIALDQALRKVVDIGVEGGIRGALKRWRRSGAAPPASPPVPELSDDQRRQVCDEVRSSLERGGMAVDEIGAVVESLDRALATDDGTPRAEDVDGRDGGPDPSGAAV